MNDTTEISRRTFYNPYHEDYFLFTNVIKSHSSLKLRSEYQDKNGKVLYVEKISRSRYHLAGTELNIERIESLVTVHFWSVEKTLEKVKGLCPLTEFIQRRTLKVVNNHEYVRFLKKRIHFDTLFQKEIPIKIGEDPPSKWRLKDVICDYDEPLEATFTKLLLHDFYKSSIYFPDLPEFVESFYKMRRKRLKFINKLTEYNYQLHSAGKLVFEKMRGASPLIHDPIVFEKLCPTSLSSDSLIPNEIKPWQKTIDARFIENFIPKEYQEKIRKSFEGKTIEQALNKRGLYANIKIDAIKQTEISRLDEHDQFLFYTSLMLCSEFEEDFIAEFKETNAKDNTTDLQKENEWVELKKVYNHFLEKENAPFITSENAEWFLKVTKIFNLSLMFFNLHFRKIKKTLGDKPYQFLLKIIEMSPGLSTAEVFSKTLHYREFSNKEKEAYLFNPKNWMDERIGRWAISIANQNVLADTLCRRIQQRVVNHPIGIIAVTGNSGSGKSYALGDELGTLNPDAIKYILRLFSSMTSDQVHEEGAKYIFKHLFKEVETSQEAFIIDKRFKNRETVEKYLIKPALKRNCSVFLSDCDVPLITTFNRILKRKPNGKDPILPIQAMIDGFKEIRAFRKELITIIEENNVFQKYALYHAGKLIGQKENGQFVVQEDCEKEYAECLREYSIEDEECLDAFIDENYIQEAIDRKDIREEQKECLTRFLGKNMTLREALAEHANAKALLSPYAPIKG